MGTTLGCWTCRVFPGQTIGWALSRRISGCERGPFGRHHLAPTRYIRAALTISSLCRLFAIEKFMPTNKCTRRGRTLEVVSSQCLASLYCNRRSSRVLGRRPQHTIIYIEKGMLCCKAQDIVSGSSRCIFVEINECRFTVSHLMPPPWNST